MISIIVLQTLFCSSVVPEGVSLSKHRYKLACKSQSIIEKEAEKYNLSPELLAALIFVESGWNRKAVSKAGACGLTQVIPKWTGPPVTSRKYTCSELKKPKVSIQVGAKILDYWIRKYGNGNIKVGLCGYNSGYRCKITLREGKKKRYRINYRAPGMRYSRKVLRYKNKINVTKKVDN